MDRSQEDYDTFSNKMPWWCLPYAIESLPQLVTTYKAHSLPHLVVVGADGKVITMEGVQSLAIDPVGKNFPWRRKRIVDILPKQYIMRKDGKNDVLYPMSYLDQRYLMLYFAASSDALSKEWNPWLVKAYNILKGKRGDDFEVCKFVLPFCCWLFSMKALIVYTLFFFKNR